jgi:hypothetical protein
MDGLRGLFLRMLVILGLVYYGQVPNAVYGQNRVISPKRVVGRVVSETGEPLSGVSVGPGTRTDIEGMFVVEYPSGIYRDTIRFSLAGYHPLTKVINEQTTQLNVVLQIGDNTWTPPKCSSSTGSKTLGSTIKISIPEKTPITHRDDDDYTYDRIFFGPEGNQEEMSFAMGGTWGPPWPSRDQLLSSSSIQERDMSCSFTGADYQGRDKSGLKWRVTGVFNEVIKYRGVSDNAAEFFDAIINSLCCNAR